MYMRPYPLFLSQPLHGQVKKVTLQLARRLVEDHEEMKDVKKPLFKINLIRLVSFKHIPIWRIHAIG